ncbi:MAG: MOMP family protein [Chlamydiales bacterium]|nr:MOMP family protein [Chlamydiales bacterium]
MKVSILNKVALALASLAVTSVAFSASDLHSRVEQLEKQMSEVGTENAFGGFGANTASARPIKDNNNWFITVDVLYWKPGVGGTEFAYSDNNPAIQYPVKGRTKEIDFSWDWGARVGLGYNFCHDGWDLYAMYTYFSNGSSSSVSGGCNSAVMPLRGGICTGADNQTAQAFFAQSAKSQFDFDFDSIDLNLGRNYFVSKYLSFRPFFGVKTAWIDLDQETRFCGGSGSTTFCGLDVAGLGPNSVKINEDSDFWGIGPEVGMNGKWHLAKGFSFFADALGALLYGYFDVDHREKFTGTPYPRIKLSGNVHKMVPTAQLFAGVGYDVFFDCDKQHFGVRVGYDCQYWWRANQMLKIDDAAPLKYERWSEDVSMHGVTVDFRWDF